MAQKQLSELLQQQQEPFDFKSYIQENGLSSKSLQRTRSMGSAAVGFFRSILTKLVNKKTFRKSVSFDDKSSDSARLSVFSCFTETGSRTPDYTFPSKQLSPVSVLEFYNHGCKEDGSSTTSSYGSPRETQDVYEEAEKVRNDKKIITWQRIRGDDMSSLIKLLGSDISDYSKEWRSFDPDVTELGTELESAIFEDIVDEIVLDMLV